MSNIKLSILICSTNNRAVSFLPKIMSSINQQVKDKVDVEVLCIVDNKTMMLGSKRNICVQLAQGEYVVFVDDDDRITDDYVEQLLVAIQTGVDIIVFEVEVSLNEAPSKKCYYNKDYLKDYNEPNSYHRLPNHIMCVKRSIALETPYKDILRGEDSAYALDLKPKLKTQHQINKVLYYYDFNSQTTETQKTISTVLVTKISTKYRTNPNGRR